MPKIIGLTGGIGSGKSRVVKLFESLNVPCYIADIEAKRIMNTNQDVKAAVKNLFGKEAYIEEQLNRPYIGQIVFSSPEKLKALNAIVHPAVAKDFTTWVAAQTSPYVIKEVAILFETGGYKQVDKSILITAPKEIRINRVMQRDNATKEEVLARMNNQWSDEQRISLADYSIENIDWEKTKKSIRALHEKLLAL